MKLLHCISLLLFIPSKLDATLANLGPPKLISQSPEEVWYKLDISSNPLSKPTLKCQASENAESYKWYKNGELLEVGSDMEWILPGQSGTLVINNPKREHQGYYQCFVSNIFGTAVSNKIFLRLGVLEHFVARPMRTVEVVEGDALTLECNGPRGNPEPSIFWLYRDTEQESVIETIRRRHITADDQGRLHFSSVEPSDGKSTLMYECAATSPVLHGEYRSGDQIQLRVVQRAGNEPVPINALYLSPSEVTIKAGGRLKIQCIFGGRPVPNVVWTKLDGDLPKYRMKSLSSAESDFGKSLIIENVHPGDAGRYECQAQHLTHIINVRVLAAPYWDLEPPQDVTQSEESTTELECLASGHPEPIIRWSMNGIPLHELKEDSRRLILDNGRILRLSDLNHDVDTGVYQCNASNPLGYIYANAYVHVRAHAPRFLMPTQRVWKVVIHSTVSLNCDVDAAPEAIVRWVDTDDRPLQIRDAKTQLLGNNTFVIHDVNKDDEGLYYCNVSNKYGINRATNKLQVYKPTYFVKIPTPKRLTLEAGQTTELFCQAVSDPRLPIDYRWTINGERINNSETFQILKDRLRIVAARGRHSGIIDCAAVTDVDVKLASMQLIVKDVPANPEVDVPVCSERKAVIKWKRSNDHADVIRKYVVEVMTDFRKGFWERVVEEANVNKQTFEVDVTLTPWVNYTFRVIAENSHGRSDAKVGSDVEDVAFSVKCNTRSSFPYTNPTGVWAEGNEPDNLIIYWNPMDKYYWNAPNLQYLIRYKLSEPHAAWTEFLVEDPLANHTIIREQPTFREYLVQVKAINAIGPSILEPETIKGYSGEDIPTAAPTEFKVVEVKNFTSVQFSWVEIDPDTTNGKFEGYEIEYWKDHGRRYKVSVPAGFSNKTITTFAANANYSAIIKTKNKHYVSHASNEVHFEMPEGIPSKVHNLRVLAVGAHSLLIQWERPKVPNGIIRGYFLSFENDKNETEETYVVHKRTYYLHERCSPDTTFKVGVWAETSAGEGAKLIRIVRTWPAGKPDDPVFEVVNVTKSSMTVKWIPSNSSIWKMPGSSFSVNYTLDGNDDYMESQRVYLPDTLIALENLQEATRYSLIGVARDGNEISKSNPLPIQTLSKINMTEMQKENLRSIVWFIAILIVVCIAMMTIFLTCCCEERRGRRYGVRRKEMEIRNPLQSEEERKFLEYQYGYKS